MFKLPVNNDEIVILSISRRTDIPAFYSEWFFNRVMAGFVNVRNPLNRNQVSEILINEEVIDCFVFWTKNPKPMLFRLPEIDRYPYYFLFTINPYNSDIEKLVGKKNELINTFKKLSSKVGPSRVIWRYDPILLSSMIDIEYHIKYFEVLASMLSGYTNRCVISFLDEYKRNERSLKSKFIRTLNLDEVYLLAQHLGLLGKKYGIAIQSCAEEYDLNQFGIKHGSCIDPNIINSISTKQITYKKDKNQRKECGCIESVDIGEYNTCTHNCLYCYANYSQLTTEKKSRLHNPNSPILIGELTSEDIINKKAIKLQKSMKFK